jgi:hypothetical protein
LDKRKEIKKIGAHQCLNPDESPSLQCPTQFADKMRKLAAMVKTLISSSMNPDGKPPCRKVLNNLLTNMRNQNWEEKNVRSYENYPNSNRLDKPNNNAAHQCFFEHIKPWLKPPCRNVVHNLVTKMRKLAPMHIRLKI